MMIDLLFNGRVLITERHRPTADFVLTVGHTDEKGIPRNKNKLYFRTPQAGVTLERQYGKHTVKRSVRAFMDRYSEYRDGVKEIQAILSHSDLNDGLNVLLQAYKTPYGWKKEQPPANRPFCTSKDGVTAERWRAENGWETVECNAEQCPFASGYGDKAGNPLCKPKITLAFFGGPLEERGFLESKSWNSLANIKKWVTETMEEWGQQMAIHQSEAAMQWQGLPIVIRLAERSAKRANGEWARWPEIHITTQVTMEDWINTILSKREQILARVQALAMPTAAQLEATYQKDGEPALNGGRLTLPSPEVLNEKG